MKFTDVTSKYSGPDRMDFTEWLEKAEHAFQVMGLQEAKEKVEIFPVYMEEPCNDVATHMVVQNVFNTVHFRHPI